MSPRSRRAVLLGAATISAALALTGAVTAQAAAPNLSATFAQTSVWTGGYGAGYTIANRGDAPATGWTVEFDLPAGTAVSSSWSSVKTQAGQHYKFTNAGFNGTVKPGATANFGFNVAGSGLPSGCTVNGLPCAGGGPVTTTPAPTTTTPPPTTTTTPPPAGDTVNVSTAAQLQAALAAAAPGQAIKLAAGTYRGSFVTTKAGTAAKPITLSGPANAVLINDGPSGDAPDCPAPTPGWDSGYGLWLSGAPYWNLTGFTVQESKKGIVVDNSPHTTIDGVTVNHVDEEAIHFRRSSADSVLKNSTITYTGLVQPGYGEGVYLGSANSNWACHGNSGGVDRGDRIQVLDNHIGPFIAAEPIDVKEGTFDGVIRGNTFDGRGISGENSADSWIDVKGIGYTIEDNTGTFSAPGTFANGYENHNTSTSPSFANGCGNVWRNNKSDLGGVGAYAIKISSVSKCAANPNVVYASNTVTNAQSGLTNIPGTP
ncbi:cellulose-binding domain-containing protein [Amycolatopsis sp. OK19-0408]|uniref:Cellulose-binding domain-containing protein n=1 Tax=Amycolatopsis iheyensis TaxID=2945988 RepID=A0A9X2NB94_9PSEU|nr:cellulose-binding domain-containing protein [Amycolatopsis iheyensis]MCR6483917.1 cellulose-binding domain-containing protein [Amycolatopsis iheyensis]